MRTAREENEAIRTLFTKVDGIDRRTIRIEEHVKMTNGKVKMNTKLVYLLFGVIGTVILAFGTFIFQILLRYVNVGG